MGQMPREHVASGARDQHHRIAPYPDAVEEDDVVDLACAGGDRPQLPEPRALAPEGAAASRHVLLGGLGEEPTEEGVELFGGRIDAVGERSSAAFASPSLSAR